MAKTDRLSRGSSQQEEQANLSPSPSEGFSFSFFFFSYSADFCIGWLPLPSGFSVLLTRWAHMPFVRFCLRRDPSLIETGDPTFLAVALVLGPFCCFFPTRILASSVPPAFPFLLPSLVLPPSLLPFSALPLLSSFLPRFYGSLLGLFVCLYGFPLSPCVACYCYLRGFKGLRRVSGLLKPLTLLLLMVYGCPLSPVMNGLVVVDGAVFVGLFWIPGESAGRPEPSCH